MQARSSEAMSITRTEYESLQVGDIVKASQPQATRDFYYACPYGIVVDRWEGMRYFSIRWSRFDGSRTDQQATAHRLSREEIERIVERVSDAE